MQLSESAEGWPSHGREGGRTANTVYFSENFIGTDSWQCRYIRVRRSYAVLNRAEKHVLYGE